MIKRQYEKNDKNIIVDIDYITTKGEISWAYDLRFEKENSRSIYAKSPIYAWVYRIEKTTGKVFCIETFGKKEVEEVGTIVMVNMW